MAKQKVSEESAAIRREKRITHIKQQIPYYVMMLIPVAYFALICYWPMFGVAIAFQNYKIGDPFISVHSRWAGLNGSSISSIIRISGGYSATRS